MTNRIALLGWGSLLWDANVEFDYWHGPWLFDGPILCIEFSRISQSRHGALTLVIDRENGVDTQVAYCLSKRMQITDAVADLRKREKTGPSGVGWLNCSDNGQYRDEISTASIQEWARRLSFDGVVWTDLQSNFREQRKLPFSAEAAVAYVRSLSVEGQAMTFDYIARAPAFVQTPIRRALSKL